jgi:hypothetical protein
MYGTVINDFPGGFIERGIDFPAGFFLPLDYLFRVMLDVPPGEGLQVRYTKAGKAAEKKRPFHLGSQDTAHFGVRQLLNFRGVQENLIPLGNRDRLYPVRRIPGDQVLMGRFIQSYTDSRRITACGTRAKPRIFREI